MIKRAFTEHPESVGESYLEHMGMAFGFGAKMVASGFACLIHGLFPFLFVRTGKDCINDLHDRMVINRDCRNKQSASNALPRHSNEPSNLSAAE